LNDARVVNERFQVGVEMVYGLDHPNGLAASSVLELNRDMPGINEPLTIKDVGFT
jgi:hypothetical protein